MRILGLMTLLLLLSASLLAQTERIIAFPVFPPLDNAPGMYIKDQQTGRLVATDLKGLEVVEVRVEGQPITPGHPFSAPSDWLATLHVKLKNVSERRISSARLSFVLPEAKAGEVTMGFNFEYGAGLRTAPNPIVSPEPPIDPGQTIELGLTNDRYKFIFNGVAQRTGVTDYRTLWIRAAMVVFEDGTAWFSYKVPYTSSATH